MVNILDWMFVGEVVKQSDVVADVRLFWSNRRQSRFLVARRCGKHRLVLKEVEKSLGIPCGVEYTFISASDVPQLRESFPNLQQWFDEVEGLIRPFLTRKNSERR